MQKGGCMPSLYFMYLWVLTHGGTENPSPTILYITKIKKYMNSLIFKPRDLAHFEN